MHFSFYVTWGNFSVVHHCTWHSWPCNATLHSRVVQCSFAFYIFTYYRSQTPSYSCRRRLVCFFYCHQQGCTVASAASFTWLSQKQLVTPSSKSWFTKWRQTCHTLLTAKGLHTSVYLSQEKSSIFQNVHSDCLMQNLLFLDCALFWSFLCNKLAVYSCFLYIFLMLLGGQKTVQNVVLATTACILPSLLPLLAFIVTQSTKQKRMNRRKASYILMCTECASWPWLVHK